MNKKPLSDEEIRTQLKKLNRPEAPDELWSQIESGLKKEAARKGIHPILLKLTRLSVSPAFMVSSAAAILIAVIAGLYFLPASYFDRQMVKSEQKNESEQDSSLLEKQGFKINETHQLVSSEITKVVDKVQNKLNAAFTRTEIKSVSKAANMADSLKLNLASMADLELFVKKNRDKVDPHYYAVTQERLSLLDQSISECKKALQMNELNKSIARFLDRSSKEKLKTLQSLVDYIKDEKNENKH
ncbi:MAG: hypothetical protein LCH54_15855 [Bacteroidetes bacterium]|nr:hypothetical protein [Bacteroidota bacterium]